MRSVQDFSCLDNTGSALTEDATTCATFEALRCIRSIRLMHPADADRRYEKSARRWNLTLRPTRRFPGIIARRAPARAVRRHWEWDHSVPSEYTSAPQRAQPLASGTAGKSSTDSAAATSPIVDWNSDPQPRRSVALLRLAERLAEVLSEHAGPEVQGIWIDLTDSRAEPIWCPRDFIARTSHRKSRRQS
jgi:hypothetical protein